MAWEPPLEVKSRRSKPWSHRASAMASIRARWREMISLGQRENVYFDLAAMPDFFDEEGWPFPTALELFRQVKETVGIEKLVWGSDIPSTLCRATYPQMIEMFRRTGLSDAELDRLFYTNALAAYGLPAKEDAK